VPAVLWWDTPHFGMSGHRAGPLHALLELKPGIITNNRLGGGFQGDTETPEQHIPPTGFPGRDWEVCMTMNDTWGYKSYDDNWKPVEGMIRMLADIASKGGNYLLNVGPTAEGEIPEPSIERLRRIGEWMKVNGESIHGTRANPFGAVEWGRITSKCTGGTTTLYLHVFDWPQGDEITLRGLPNRIIGARVLDGGAKLDASSKEEGLTLKLPAEAPDAVNSVIVLEVEGEVDVERPGSFAVEVIASTKHHGVHVTAAAGDAVAAGTVASTGSWGSYATVSLGRLEIAKAGRQVVTMNVTAENHRSSMQLQRLVLKPLR